MITIQTNKWMKIKKYRNLIKFNKWKKKTILIDIQQSKHFFWGGGDGLVGSKLLNNVMNFLFSYFSMLLVTNINLAFHYSHVKDDSSSVS